MNIAITYFPPREFACGTRYDVTWPALVKRLAQRRELRRKEDAPGFSLATFNPNRRKLENVEKVYAVGLDLDHGLPGWDELAAAFQSVACFVHTTWSSTIEALRARAFLRLSRPVNADEYYRVWTFCKDVVERGGLVVDGQAKDPSRFWYLPASAPNAPFHWAEGGGDPIDVDLALEVVPTVAPSLPPALEALDRYQKGGGPGTIHDRMRLHERASRYIDACEPAVSGQGGHLHTFLVAQKLVRGFGVDEQAAFDLMWGWNRRCAPPWKEWEIRRKIRQAIERGTLPPGSLRDAQRRT